MKAGKVAGGGFEQHFVAGYAFFCYSRRKLLQNAGGSLSDLSCNTVEQVISANLANPHQNQ